MSTTTENKSYAEVAAEPPSAEALQQQEADQSAPTTSEKVSEAAENIKESAKNIAENATEQQQSGGIMATAQYLKEEGLNTLELIGEKLQTNAQYYKEVEVGTQNEKIQYIKEVALNTIEYVGEKTQQTSQYLKGETNENPLPVVTEDIKQKVQSTVDYLKGANATQEKTPQEAAKDKQGPSDQPAVSGVSLMGQEAQEAIDGLKQKPENPAEQPGLIEKIKEGSLNTLGFVGEKIQQTAEYLKGNEEDQPSVEEATRLQYLKGVALDTLEFVGEKTQQTAGYLKGETTENPLQDVTEMTREGIENMKLKAQEAAQMVSEKVEQMNANTQTKPEAAQ